MLSSVSSATMFSAAVRLLQTFPDMMELSLVKVVLLLYKSVDFFICPSLNYLICLKDHYYGTPDMPINAQTSSVCPLLCND